MKVKYLNPNDEASESKPLKFTRWKTGLSDDPSDLDRLVEEYMDYLAKFNSEKNNVELTHHYSNDGLTFLSSKLPPNPKTKIWYVKCPKKGDLFIEVAGSGEVNFYKGYLNSGEY